MGFVTTLPSMVVAQTATDSNVLKEVGYGATGDVATPGTGFRRAKRLIIVGPATLPETATVQVSADEAGSQWANLINPATASTDLTIAAGKAVVVAVAGFKAVRIHLSGAAAAQRTFTVSGEME
jgi:hypothetical protein